MITEDELNRAIQIYEDADNPNSQTCITLAAFYTVKEHLYPDSGASFDAGVTYNSDTDFGRAVQKAGTEKVMGLMDELMETLKVLHPPLYESVMLKLGDT